MVLVRKLIVKPHSEWFSEIDRLCFLAKNLYNSTLYAVRQHYFETGEYLSYYKVTAMFTHECQVDYCALPRKVSKMIQMLVDHNFKAFFALLRKAKSGKVNKKISVPAYLDKINGRQVVQYPKDALSFKKKGFIKLSGTNICIKTDIHAKFVRLIPHNGYYVIEIGYEKQEEPLKEDNGRYAAIDIGFNNLAAVSSNVFKPFIINGKPLKSVNQFYNKRRAELQAKAETLNNVGTTKRIKAITRIRECLMNDYMHKASRFLVNHLVANDVNVLVIGYNKGWRQDIKMIRRWDDNVRQNNVQIPVMRFVEIVEYKCKLAGIHVVRVDESYTSKCSFLDSDYLPTYGVDDALSCPSGKRVKRGLYISKDGIRINADINGAYNILRKYLTENEAWNESLYSDCVEVYSTPVVYNFGSKRKRKRSA